MANRIVEKEVPVNTRTYNYGCVKGKPDERDWRWPNLGTVEKDTLVYDLRTTGFVPAIHNQLQLGSCTAFGAGDLFQYNLAKDNISGEKFEISHLFEYYYSRILDGSSTNQDAGATVRSAVKAMNNYGACAWHNWPYDTANFAIKPPDIAYANASHRKAVGYYALNQDIASMRACLALRLGFTFGFVVYDSFESQEVARTGTVPMPSPGEQELGGHCVFCCGHNPATKRFLCRNSWGTEWGNGGYFTLPEDYVTNPNLSWDFWTVSLLRRVA